MKAELLNVEKPIAAYNEFRSQLNELQAGNAKAVFDYESPKGNKEARSHVYKLRQTKASVEKVRKAEKAVALEYGRKVDNEAKEIVAVITDMMAVHEKPLAEIEQREAERVQRHKDFINGMGLMAAQTEHEDGRQLTADEYQLTLDYLEGVAIDDTWEEFVSEAAIAKDKGIDIVRKRLSDRKQYEAEQAELISMRKEAEEREARERDERLQREAAEAARTEAEAERTRVAEEAKAEREAAERAAKEAREAAERRELELKLAAKKSERERIEADQRAANAARETEERLAREAKEKAAAEAAEQAKRDANKKHVAAINNAALQCFIGNGFSKEQAKQIVTLIAKREIDHVSIKY